MKKIVLFLIVTITSLNVQAQNEANNWAFGNGGFLTWNTTRTLSDLTPFAASGATGNTLTGLPTSPNVSSISTNEGCFTLSDTNGKLLFYSDGISVYDSRHIQMPNGYGLTGDPSSTQSGILFPYPGDSNKYVAVSVGAAGATARLCYTIIDKSLNVVGGVAYGDVVAAQKNISFPEAINGLFQEEVTSINIPGTSDFWVVAPARRNTNLIYAWKFTKDGPQAPIKSTMSGVTVTGTSVGYFKLTPDGKHFVWPTWYNSKKVVYGDFDINSGVFSNCKATTVTGYYYGVEYSPDQKLVYITNETGIIVYKADEFFSSTNLATVTKKTYSGIMTGTNQAIQLGPDGRMYTMPDRGSRMIVIADPNNFDSPKIYTTAYGFVGGTATYPVMYGLPSFSANLFSLKPKAKKFACTGYDYKFTTDVDISGSNVPVKLTLNYGDGNTGTINIVAGQSSYNIAHTYLNPGTYTVTITPVKADTSTLSSTIVSAEVIDCTIRSNRMIRVDLQNLNTLQGAKP